MTVFRFPSVVERAIMREAEIDGGHEVNITPVYLRTHPFLRRDVDVNGSPNYRETVKQKGVNYAA